MTPVLRQICSGTSEWVMHFIPHVGSMFISTIDLMATALPLPDIEFNSYNGQGLTNNISRSVRPSGFWMYVCLSVCLSVWLTVSRSSSVYPVVRPSIWMCVYLAVRMCVCLDVCVLVCVDVCVLVRVDVCVCPSGCMCTCPSGCMCQYVSLSVWILDVCVSVSVFLFLRLLSCVVLCQSKCTAKMFC